MTRGGRARRGGSLAAAAAALLVASPGTGVPAALHPARPAPLHDSALLAHGMKAPFEAPEDAAGAPPATLPPGANLGMAQLNTGGATLDFPSSSMSFPGAGVTAAQAPAAVPQGSAAVPGAAPATGAPSGGARVDAGPLRVPSDGESAADAGPPDALPLGSRFGAAQLNLTNAEMRFADSHLAAASSAFAAASGAALPGGMAFREEGRGLRVTLDADVLFDFDRAELRRDAGPRLQRLMEEVTARIQRPAFRVEGHTDWIGSDAYNLRLSTRRAESVRDWLVRQGGVPRPAVSTVGYGEGRPVAPNSTPDGRDDPEGRQRNRRVELLVTPR